MTLKKLMVYTDGNNVRFVHSPRQYWLSERTESLRCEISQVIDLMKKLNVDRVEVKPYDRST